LSNQNLLKETKATSSSSMSTVAHKGNFSISCFTNSCIDEVWIINNSALDYMTGNWTNFSTYEECDDDIKITMANCSISKVVGHGFIDILRLRLNLVLHVLKLNCNLVSISKLLRLKMCNNLFPFSLCVYGPVFQTDDW